MKIHRIETFNLASLYGEQVVDFDAAFGDTPLVLVHGPTGAGKSTLLDAVSLALYGQTPRLDGRTSRGNDRGRDFDPANVMSHGTGRCRASVVLSVIGPDGHRQYRRATWEVWRSRDKPDGNLQRPLRALEALDGPEAASGTAIVESQTSKTYDPHFTELLGGLAFADFQRTVLLPQGAFAEFLRGDEAERARLLERLTDTEHFRRIGRRAHKRFQTARDRVKELGARLEGADLMSNEDLDALRARHAEAVEAHEVASRAQDGAVAQATWWAELVRRLEALERAREGVADAQRMRATHRTTLDALAAHEALSDTFEALDARDAAVSAHAEAMARRDEATRAEREATEALATAVEGEATATAAAEAFAARRAQWVPRIEACVQKASDLEGAHEANTKARADAEGAQQEHAVANERAAALRTRIDDVERQLEPLAWLEANDVADAYPRWATRDESRRDLERKLRESTAERERLAAAVDAAVEAAAGQDAAREQLANALDEARSRYAEATAALEGLGVEAPNLQQREPARRARVAERDALRAALDAVQVARRADRAEIDAAKVLREATGAVTAAEKAAASADAACADAAARLEATEAELADARLAREAAADTVALLRARTALRDGDPCPVCGSTEHHVVSSEDEAGVLAGFEQRRAEAEESVTAARDALGDATEARGAARAALARATERRGEAQTSHDGAVEARAEAFAAVPEPWAVAPSVDGLALESVEGRVVRALESAEAAMEREAAAWDAFVAAHEAVAASERALTSHDRDRKGASEDLARLRQALASEDAALADRRRELDGVVDQLHDAFEAAAEPALERADDGGIDLALTLQTVERSLRQAADLTSAKATLATELQEVERSLAGLAERMRATGEAAETAKTALDAAIAAHEAALEALAEAVGHRDPDAASKTLATDEATVTATLEAAKAAHVGAQNAVAARRATLEEKQKVVDTLADAAEAAQTQWREALDALRAEPPSAVSAVVDTDSLDEDAIRAVRLDPDALDDARAVDDRTSGALRDAHSTHAARSGDVLEHVGGAAESIWDAIGEDASHKLRAELTAIAGAVVGDARGDGEVANDGASDVDRARVLDDVRAALTAADEVASNAKYAATATRDAVTTLAVQLRTEDERRERAEDLAAELAEARGTFDLWTRMNDLIGVGNGERFQRFAQALGLGELIEAANVRLRVMNPRYRLAVARDDDGTPRLDFAVIDEEQAGRVRAISTLSGGESFMCSLALALGLADFRHHTLPIETLLLDEGFGTLDRASVDLVMKALETLSATSGAQVILISHVASLRERVEARVCVEPLGGGRSEARVDA